MQGGGDLNQENFMCYGNPAYNYYSHSFEGKSCFIFSDNGNPPSPKDASYTKSPAQKAIKADLKENSANISLGLYNYEQVYANDSKTPETPARSSITYLKDSLTMLQGMQDTFYPSTTSTNSASTSTTPPLNTPQPQTATAAPLQATTTLDTATAPLESTNQNSEPTQAKLDAISFEKKEQLEQEIQAQIRQAQAY